MKTIRFLGLRIDFSWWAEENTLGIKLWFPPKFENNTGSWKAGYDVSIDFLGLRLGFMRWSQARRFDLDISPAYLMALRPDGSKRIWRGARIGGSCLMPIGLK